MFFHEICFHAGILDVEGALGSLEFHQVARWVEYAAAQPFGEDRADFRIAQLCAIVASGLAAFGSRKGRPAPNYKITDFMYSTLAKRSDRESSRELRSAEAFAAAMNAMAAAGIIKTGGGENG